MDRKVGELPPPARAKGSSAAALKDALVGVKPINLRGTTMVPCKPASPIILKQQSGSVLSISWVAGFSRHEVFALVSAPRKPLLGHRERPSVEWLLEPEECTRGEFSGAKPLDASDVHIALVCLLHAFKRIEPRLAHTFTKESLNLAKTARHRAISSRNGLNDPRWVRLLPAESRDSSLANIEKDIAQFSQLVDRISREIELQEVALRHPFLPALQPHECKSKEDFIRGPLRECYRRLFGRVGTTSPKPNGPFPRFAECFLAFVRYPTPPGTICSAIKKGSRKKRSTARLARQHKKPINGRAVVTQR
jgi:hypothetical protein